MDWDDVEGKRMTRCRTGRINPFLWDIVNSRSRKFKTTMTKEQGNVAHIMNQIGEKLGVDFKTIPVTKGKAKIEPKYNIVVFK